MNEKRFNQPPPQLPLPGISERVREQAIAGCDNVAPGQEVLYLGRISGGPRFRSRGVVKQAFRRKAVVDMGRMGTWHIPYYFLSIPRAA